MQGKYTSLWAHFPQTCQSKSKSKSPSEYRPHNSLTQRRMHAKQEEITSATHSQVTDFIKMIKKPAWRTAWLTGRLTEPTVCSWPQEWKPKNIQQPTASGNNRKHLSTLCYAPLEPRCVSHSSAKSTHKPNVTQGAGKKVKKNKKNTENTRRKTRTLGGDLNAYRKDTSTNRHLHGQGPAFVVQMRIVVGWCRSTCGDGGTCIDLI